MEFHEKLLELRKAKYLTQEDLAGFLYVSRTAISKWESGRGYPNIDSLKAISKFFGVTIDDLLSGEELLILAEEDNQKNETICGRLYLVCWIAPLRCCFLCRFLDRKKGHPCMLFLFYPFLKRLLI